MKRAASLVLFLCYFTMLVYGSGLNEEFQWTRITYEWPKNGERLTRQTARQTYQKGRPAGRGGDQDAIVFEGDTNAGQVSEEDTQQGQVGAIDYNYVNNIPMGANVWKNKLFITVPRRRLGIPSTLNYIPLNSRSNVNVPLKPYPSWRLNMLPDATGNGENLVSVYRTAIDPCDRMWFVDSGIVETLGNATQVKPSSIVIIDLNTDKIIHRYEIPSDQLRSNSGLASITVDVTKDTCEDAYAYIPDLSGYGVIVYDLKQGKSWRVTHNYFYLEPSKGEFLISGHNFQWNDGIFSIELSSLKSDGTRDMYFHSMAGTHLYRVSTAVMRNESLATRTYHGNDFKDLGDRGDNSQTSKAELHQPTGILFLGLVNQNALGCWNTKEPLSTISIVQKDDEKMIYPSDVKVNGDKVWLLTNRMPEFLYGRLNYDVVNFRVWSNTVAEAIKGTKCQKSRRRS